MNAQPEFQMDDVDMEEVENLWAGEAVLNKLLEINHTGQFEDFVLSTFDKFGNQYEYRCFGYTLLNRYGINRIYLSLCYTEKNANSDWYTYYMARLDNGIYVIVQETDEEMREEFRMTMLNIQNEKLLEDTENNNATTETTEKTQKKKSGWVIALKIIGFPFWLIWQFIKAILSLLNIGFGDSPMVKSFKKGFNGESKDFKEYTFINDMGCQQTVYSSDGKTFYNADGSYAGKSNDGGKTIY